MRLFIVLIICFLAIWFGYIDIDAEEGIPKELQHELIQTDNGYIFRGQVFVKTDSSCLIDIVYNFKHLEKFVKGASSIELIRQGNNWHEIRYVYNWLFFNNESVYRKILNAEERIVNFEMIDIKQKSLVLPKVISSKGHYKIAEEKGGCWVEYIEECKLGSNKLKGIYVFKVKTEAKKFLKGLKDYAERACD